MPVAEEKIVRPERGVEVMHEIDVRGLVETAAVREQLRPGEELLGVFVPYLGEQHRMVLFVHVEVARRTVLLLALEKRRNRVHAMVYLGTVFGLPRDDERRARFVDEDR